MHNKNTKQVRIKTILCGFLALFIFGLFINVNEIQAQRSEHLTEEEIELIRFHQEIDNRMKVYVKAIERRFMSINGVSNLNEKELKNLSKDSKKWGELPKGSQTKMLANIENILDEAIDKIDDVAARDSKSKLFSTAVHILADAATKFTSKFKVVVENGVNERERALISSSLDYCNDIIEASSKVKKPPKTKKKKNK